MKKILFIIPGLGTGGTNSSLDSFYTLFKDKYLISVFSISHQPQNKNYSFNEVLQRQSRILSLMCANFSDQKGIFKFFAFFIKTVQSLCRKFNIELAELYGQSIVKKIESNEKYDLVIGYQEGFATKFASLFQNTNKIAWIHCNYDYYLTAGKSEELLYDKFKKIVCVSKFTASVFTNRYPSFNRKTIYIHNLIDTERIKKLAQEPVSDIDTSNNVPILISVGRFSTVKRFSEIPRIANYLKEKGINFIWYILGPSDETPECSLFMSAMEKYPVHDCVKWLGAKLNPYPYFREANLYVCLSESEACPMVFKEAKLFGLPIVTTNFPSAFEFINEHEGIISSFEDISNAINSMINMIDNGYKMVTIDNDNKEIINRFNMIFSS